MPAAFVAHARARRIATVALVAGLSLISPAGLAARTTQAKPSDPTAVADFLQRLEQYVALHRKLEAELPKLPDEATPEQIDQSQRGLLAAIRAARPAARQGDLFTPQMTVFVKELITRTLKGPGGARLRASLMDENVKELPLGVNQRYPTEIPLATMPPTLLKELPALPEDMEFRFVASQFVLLDTHAQLVVDFIPGALPLREVR
jgi:hypothetical protein